MAPVQAQKIADPPNMAASANVGPRRSMSHPPGIMNSV
jgi:hypothetical protein